MHHGVYLFLNASITNGKIGIFIVIIIRKEFRRTSGEIVYRQRIWEDT